MYGLPHGRKHGSPQLIRAVHSKLLMPCKTFGNVKTNWIYAGYIAMYGYVYMCVWARA